MADFLSSKLKEADLRVPAKPPSRAANVMSSGRLNGLTSIGGEGSTTSRSKVNTGNLNGGGSITSTNSNGRNLPNAHSSIIVQPRSFELDL